MKQVFKSGKWEVVLRVVNELSAAQIQTSTDTKGLNGHYTVSVRAGDAHKAERCIRQLEIIYP